MSDNFIEDVNNMVESDESQCKNCGADLTYSVEKNNLYCDHCGAVFNINSKPFTTKKLFNPALVEQEQIEKKQILVRCPSCGATESTSSRNISHTCPFCGSAKVIAEENVTYSPQAVLPFTLTKEKVSPAFKKWAKRKLFAPSSFKKIAKLNKFQPVYTPAWVFDSNVRTNYAGVLQYDRTETYHSNGKTHTRTVRENKHVSGVRNDSFKDQIIGCGEKISRNTLCDLGSFNLSNLKVYNTGYLAGFLANHYSIDLPTSWRYATQEIAETIKERIQYHYHADRTVSMNLDSTFSDCGYSYTLLPVWICNYMFKQKNYQIYVNDSTGKVTGKYPKSAIRITIAVILGILLLVGLLYLNAKYGD